MIKNLLYVVNVLNGVHVSGKTNLAGVLGSINTIESIISSLQNKNGNE